MDNPIAESTARITAEPSENTSRSTRRVLTPSAEDIARFWLTARMWRPARVLPNSSTMPNSTASASAMMNSRTWANASPASGPLSTVNELASQPGAVTSTPVGPN